MGPFKAISDHDGTLVCHAGSLDKVTQEARDYASITGDDVRVVDRRGRIMKTVRPE